MMKKVTIYTLAQDLGLSHATVSLGLRDHPRIKEATRARIQAHAKAAGYYPNRLARGLKTKFSKVLGCVVPSVTSPYLAVVVDQLYRECFRNGYQLQIVLSGCDLEEEARAIEECIATPVDGMVVFSSFPPDLRFCAEKRHPLYPLIIENFPLVLLHSGWSFKKKQVFGLGADGKMAAYHSTRHLIEKGYTNIKMLLYTTRFAGSPFKKFPEASYPLPSARVDGFNLALLEGGIRADAGNVVHQCGDLEIISRSTGTNAGSQYYYDYSQLGHAGFNLAKEALEKTKRFPIGLVCGNDQIAAGVLSYCSDKGVNVPGQVGIIGCDDTLAPYLRISTFRWNYPSYAQQVISHLRAQIARHDPPSLLPITGQLIERASTDLVKKLSRESLGSGAFN